ncbi:MAG TPA: histidine kinase [Anaeromyxobacteraceae bacterium]
MISEGSAFLDRSGRVLVADATFRALLRLPADTAGASDALGRRAAGEPVLAAMLAQDGPERVVLAGADGAPPCELSRVACDGGTLLRATVSFEALPAPALEYAMLGVSLARLAGSVAHEVKNPLNAMALQLALLGDKIATASDSLASACAGNLGSLKNQIGRVNEVVRRYLDVADPSPGVDFDAGSLLADTANLFGHEARRRRVALACEAAPGTVRAGGDPERAARLLLGLLWRAITSTPEGGRLLARAVPSGTEVVLAVEHARGTPDPALAWVGAVVAAGARDLGGRLEESTERDLVRAALVLPKERPL